MENGPFEFRLRETEYPNLEDLIQVNWEDRWRTELPPYTNWYGRAIPDDGSNQQQNTLQQSTPPTEGGSIGGWLTSVKNYFVSSPAAKESEKEKEKELEIVIITDDIPFQNRL